MKYGSVACRTVVAGKQKTVPPTGFEWQSERPIGEGYGQVGLSAPECAARQPGGGEETTDVGAHSVAPVQHVTREPAAGHDDGEGAAQRLLEAVPRIVVRSVYVYLRRHQCHSGSECRWLCWPLQCLPAVTACSAFPIQLQFGGGRGGEGAPGARTLRAPRRRPR